MTVDPVSAASKTERALDPILRFSRRSTKACVSVTHSLGGVSALILFELSFQMGFLFLAEFLQVETEQFVSDLFAKGTRLQFPFSDQQDVARDLFQCRVREPFCRVQDDLTKGLRC